MNRLLTAAGLGILPLATTGPAFAESTIRQGERAPTEREMMDLIRAQAERIRALEARLDQIEAGKPAPTGEVAQTTPPPVRPPRAPVILTIDRRPPPDPEMHVDWKSGAPNFASRDGNFSFRPRGRMILDLDTTFGSRFTGRNGTTTGARAARMGFEGTLFEKGFYTLDVEFGEPSQAEVLSAFVGFHDQVGKVDYDVRVGSMFNDRSLEGQTGSQNTPFMERNFVANAILPRRGFFGVGSMVRAFGPGWHASLSVAGDPIDGSVSESDSLSVSGRAHFNPVKSEDGAVHVGFWGFREWLSGGGSSLTRDTLLAARFNTDLRVSTGPLPDAERSTGYGAEFAWAHRNLYAWGEYGRREIDFLPGATTRDFAVEAWSLSGGWVLTGENAPYSARQGNFRPMKIARSLADGGPGAIEVVARHQRLDNSETPMGGEGEETSLGLNWYPVPLLRFALNWTHWEVENRVAPFDGPDDGDAITTRAQIVF